MDTFVEETEGFQSSEEIPETQVCGVGGQNGRGWLRHRSMGWGGLWLLSPDRISTPMCKVAKKRNFVQPLIKICLHSEEGRGFNVGEPKRGTGVPLGWLRAGIGASRAGIGATRVGSHNILSGSMWRVGRCLPSSGWHSNPFWDTFHPLTLGKWLHSHVIT